MMNMRSVFATSTARAVAVLVLLTAGLAILIGACTDRLSGEFSANEPPVVFFTNIPPDGEQFSRNPVVYWYGTDRDGLIDYYRYHVWAVPDGNTMLPEDYIATVHDSLWTIIDVNPTAADQKTTNVVELQADSSDPVTSYVRQYVFLQAFDHEGMGSEIVYRLFSRNTNPPETEIFAIGEGITPFVNAVERGGASTGVFLRWRGSDPIDYPKDPPPLEFEWRLFGPYGGEGEPTVAEFYENFRIDVFLTREGKRYRNGEYIYTCDTTIAEEIVIECDSFLVDKNNNAAMDAIYDNFGTDYGRWKQFLRINDADFASSEFNVIAARSSRGNPALPEDQWVMATADTIYNVFRDYPTDETIRRDFIFWVRCRDDAFVVDLAPPFIDFPVVEPRHERDVLVIDFSLAGPASPRYPAVGRAYWRQWIDTWGEKRMAAIGRPDSTFQYDDTTAVGTTEGIYRDFIVANQMLSQAPISLESVLQHKVVVLVNDGVYRAGLHNPQYRGQVASVWRGIDAGVNAWLTMRATTIGGAFTSSAFGVPVSLNYIWYFGVSGTNFSGWMCHAGTIACGDTVRIEDFVGTYSLKPDVWPELDVDDSLHRVRYDWNPQAQFGLGYDSTLPAVPEVGWSIRVFGTDPIYLYKSLYGPNHPLGGNYVFEGAPVAHTFDRGFFRTINMNFTLTAIKQEQADSVVAVALNWLMEPWDIAEGRGAPAGVPHYNENAPAKLTLDEARSNYLQRVSW
jgi:hypothetical protein